MFNLICFLGIYNWISPIFENMKSTYSAQNYTAPANLSWSMKQLFFRWINLNLVVSCWVLSWTATVLSWRVDFHSRKFNSLGIEVVFYLQGLHIIWILDPLNFPSQNILGNSPSFIPDQGWTHDLQFQILRHCPLNHWP